MTSGLTVVVGFAALLITPLVETRSVGLGGLVVVAVAVLLSTTLLPALLAILGRVIDTAALAGAPAGMVPRPDASGRNGPGPSAAIPGGPLTLGGLAIALLTAPVFWIQIGLPSRHWWPTDTEAGEGRRDARRHGRGGRHPARAGAWSRCRRGNGGRGHGAPRAHDALAIRSAPTRASGTCGAWWMRSRGTSLLAYSVLYSDLDAARKDRIPDFLDAYLSRDHRMTLMDVILSDTTSLTTRDGRRAEGPRTQDAEPSRDERPADPGRRLRRVEPRFPGGPAPALPAPGRTHPRRPPASCSRSRSGRCWSRSRRSS